MEVVILCGYSLPFLSSKPAGAYTIANCVRDYGLECQVIDFVFRMTPEQRTKAFKKYIGPDTKFILFSTTLAGEPGNQYVYLEQLDSMFKPLMEEATSYAPQAKWVVGGHKVLRENSGLPFYYSIRGQGEEAMIAVLDHEFKGTDIKIGEVSASGSRVIYDKDYQYAAFNATPAIRFHDNDFVMPGETVPLEISRGCIFNCTYCDYYLNGKSFGDYTKQMNVVYTTMMHNYDRYGVTRYIITDDTLNDSLDKALFMRDLRKRLPFELEYCASCRIEIFTKHPEMADILAESGMRAVNFGIETFNKRAGQVVGKGFGDKAKGALEMLYSAWRGRVAVSVNFILGLPYDTKEMLQEQHDWVCNSPTVDSLLVHPFFIWRSKDAANILKTAELFGYYKDTGKSDNPRQIDWVSKDTSFAEMSDLANFYREDFIQRKGTVLGGSHNSFITGVVMQRMSIEEMRKRPLSELAPLFRSIIEERFHYNVSRLTA